MHIYQYSNNLHLKKIYEQKVVFNNSWYYSTPSRTCLVPSVSQHVYSQGAEKKILRLGYFPNINHAQAVIGMGNGDFQRALGAI